MRGACWIFPFEVTLAPCRGRDGPTPSGEGLGFSKVHSSPLSLLLSLGGSAGLCLVGGVADSLWLFSWALEYRVTLYPLFTLH